MRVLVVEDEPLLADAVARGLRLQAMAVDVAHDGGTALELTAITDYDVVVLDRDLPRVHGDDVARELTTRLDAPRVLMLTASDRLQEKVAGFEVGADDYLTKPFDMLELIARVRALGRRTAPAVPPVLDAHGVRLDPFRREVFREGRLVPLTRKEFAVLHVLMRAAGGVVSAEDLLERAWDENADPFTHAVRVTVSTLRKKLGSPPVIHTLTGSGYRLAGPAPDAG